MTVRLVKLTDPNGSALYVNPNFVTAVFTDDDGTNISFSGDDSLVVVSESVPDVVSKLEFGK